MPDMTEIGSHTEESQTPSDAQNGDLASAFAAFGIDVPQSQEDASEGSADGVEEDEAPAIEQQSSTRTFKVKHNKEDVEISDDQVPELLQKGLALDKVRTQKTEYEKALDEAAKLLGLKDHADFLANRERLAQQQQQRKETEFTQLREQLITDYEEAGGDPRNLEAWLDSNPLLNQAQEVLAAENDRQAQARKAVDDQQRLERWGQLYQAYPELVESSLAFEEGSMPEWYTPAMQERIARGYDPLDAYQLAHRGTLQAQTKKAAEQKAIKDQLLGRRSQVETQTPADQEPSVPQYLTNAFEAFGLDPKAAKKYVK